MTPSESGRVQSVRQRLLNLSHQSGEDYNRLLTRYASERLLFRLGKSKYIDRFILKGAQLFLVWQESLYRPTRDLDLLAFGDPSEEELADVFRSICKQVVDDDGIRFDADSMKTAPIRDENAYPGIRLRFNAYLGNARIAIQVDVGFGDTVTPSPEVKEYPALLDNTAPCVRMYSPETVIAEKFQAMVSLGIANSRMKDFYDVWVLLTRLPIDKTTLKAAIDATFTRRGTMIPTNAPVAFTDAFTADTDKQKQWKAFLSRSGLPITHNLHTVIGVLRDELMPLFQQ